MALTEEVSVSIGTSCSISKVSIFWRKDFKLLCIYLFRSRVLELDFLEILVQIINHIPSAYFMNVLITDLEVSTL